MRKAKIYCAEEFWWYEVSPGPRRSGRKSEKNENSVVSHHYSILNIYTNIVCLHSVMHGHRT